MFNLPAVELEDYNKFADFSQGGAFCSRVRSRQSRSRWQVGGPCSNLDPRAAKPTPLEVMTANPKAARRHPLLWVWRHRQLISGRCGGKRRHGVGGFAPMIRVPFLIGQASECAPATGVVLRKAANLGLTLKEAGPRSKRRFFCFFFAMKGITAPNTDAKSTISAGGNTSGRRGFNLKDRAGRAPRNAMGRPLSQNEPANGLLRDLGLRGRPAGLCANNYLQDAWRCRWPE